MNDSDDSLDEDTTMGTVDIEFLGEGSGGRYFLVKRPNTSKLPGGTFLELHKRSNDGWVITVLDVLTRTTEMLKYE